MNEVLVQTDNQSVFKQITPDLFFHGLLLHSFFYQLINHGISCQFFSVHFVGQSLTLFVRNTKHGGSSVGSQRYFIIFGVNWNGLCLEKLLELCTTLR